MATNPTIEILRPGTFRAMNGHDVTITPADLSAIAAAYSPELHEAPVVVGHPATDAPAYGWVRSVRVENDRLLAELDQVDEQFADLHRAGRYKKRSAALYTPDTPNNPKPGSWYLRHVGMLGAQPPAVKGLRDAHLSDESEGVEILEFSELPQPTREPDMTDKSKDAAALAELENQLQARADKLKAQEVELADRQQRLTEIEQREAELAQREQAAQRREMAAFADKLAGEGRILPRQTAAITEILLASPDDDATVIEFSEGEGADAQTRKGSPRALLQAFLSELPKQVEFSEFSAPDERETVARVPGYTPPQGYTVDPKSADLHRRALAFSEKNGVDYFQAIEAVERQQAH